MQEILDSLEQQIVLSSFYHKRIQTMEIVILRPFDLKRFLCFEIFSVAEKRNWFYCGIVLKAWTIVNMWLTPFSGLLWVEFLVRQYKLETACTLGEKVLGCFLDLMNINDSNKNARKNLTYLIFKNISQKVKLELIFNDD